MRPLFIKICGVTSVRDALMAADAGADAIGLNFYAASPRYVSVSRARTIAQSLPAFVWVVGIFVNESPTKVQRISKSVGLDVLQFHGDEKPAQLAQLKGRVMKAIHIGDAPVDAVARSFSSVDALVLDAAQPGYGGGGVTFDWALARRIAAKRRVLLAGGLNADNVGDAIAKVRPFGVDVASGVESAPGVKDARKVSAFVSAARNLR